MRIEITENDYSDMMGYLSTLIGHLYVDERRCAATAVQMEMEYDEDSEMVKYWLDEASKSRRTAKAVEALQKRLACAGQNAYESDSDITRG